MESIKVGLTILLSVVPMLRSATAKLEFLTFNSQPQVEIRHVLNVLTVYNPVEEQTDQTPFITASNARIDAAKLYNQEIRWMALSRNLLARWQGSFHYGDTVLLDSGDPAIDGKWVIHDTLNKRYADRGDLLFDSRVRTLGRWENVTISKYN